MREREREDDGEMQIKVVDQRTETSISTPTLGGENLGGC